MNKLRNYRVPVGFQLNDLLHAMQLWLSEQSFRVQVLPTTDGGILLQMDQKAAWRKVAGMSTTLNVVFRLTNTPDGNQNMSVEIGRGSWADKVVGGAVGTFLLWPTVITTGVGAYKQSHMPDQVFRFIRAYLVRSGAGRGGLPIEISATPPNMMPVATSTNPTIVPGMATQPVMSLGVATQPVAPTESSSMTTGAPPAIPVQPSTMTPAVEFAAPVPSQGIPVAQGSTDGNDVVSKLERLAALKNTGILTEQEFLEQKAAILAS